MSLEQAIAKMMVSTLHKRARNPAVTSPFNWYSPGMPIHPHWNGEKAIRDGYLAQTYVYACVDRIATSIARWPFRAGPDTTEPTKFNTSSQLSQFLGPGYPGPAPDWSPRQFWRYTIAQYILTGKYAWYLERTPGPSRRIIAIWPLQAQHIVPIEPSKKNPSTMFEGFTYGTKGHRGYREFKPDEIVYRWRPSQEDVKQPESWLKAAELDISTAQMIDLYDFSLMKNGAVPATLVTHEPFAEPDQRRSFRRQFTEQFGGAGNAGKTMFLEAEADINDAGNLTNNVGNKVSVERLSFSPTEMMSLEKRNAFVQDICVAFRTPLSVLGDSTRSKFQNADQDYRTWVLQTLVPLAEEMSDHVNVDIAARLDTRPSRNYGWFDLSEAHTLKNKPRYNASEVVSLRDAGILTNDESRRELGYDPLPEALVPVPLVALPPAPEKAPTAIPGPRKAVASRTPLVALVGSVVKIQDQQKVAIEQRQRGRAGRKSESLADLFDVSFWTTRTADYLSPILSAIGFDESEISDIATNLTQATADRLLYADTVDSAFRSMSKVFVANTDACDICKDLDGTENPSFEGGYDLPHPNCRCTLENS